MTRGDMKYYLKVIRKGYKGISVRLGLAHFMMIVLVGLLGFVLLSYEPADEWHNTTFTLSYFECSYSGRYSSEPVIYLYTTDGRNYALNHNTTELRNLLKEGQKYQAVYSADLFHDIIRGLEDADRQYLNAEVMRNSSEKERVWLIVFLILVASLSAIINSVYAISCIREEEKKRQERICKRNEQSDKFQFD